MKTPIPGHGMGMKQSVAKVHTTGEQGQHTYIWTFPLAPSSPACLICCETSHSSMTHLQGTQMSSLGVSRMTTPPKGSVTGRGQSYLIKPRPFAT